MSDAERKVETWDAYLATRLGPDGLATMMVEKHGLTRGEAIIVLMLGRIHEEIVEHFDDGDRPEWDR